MFLGEPIYQYTTQDCSQNLIAIKLEALVCIMRYFNIPKCWYLTRNKSITTSWILVYQGKLFVSISLIRFSSLPCDRSLLPDECIKPEGQSMLGSLDASWFNWTKTNYFNCFLFCFSTSVIELMFCRNCNAAVKNSARTRNMF